MRNSVVLIDQNDHALGVMDKLQAHEEGKLHRAFSIFIFNDAGDLLLQQRADHKYHGAGLWTNTCCSHPQWGEDVRSSALERLQYEMGMTCDLEFVYSFIYRAEVENNLTEYELDHVFVGYSNQDPVINTDEVKDFRWCGVDEVLADIRTHPSDYTVWFKEAFPELIGRIKR